MRWVSQRKALCCCPSGERVYGSARHQLCVSIVLTLADARGQLTGRLRGHVREPTGMRDSQGSRAEAGRQEPGSLCGLERRQGLGFAPWCTCFISSLQTGLSDPHHPTALELTSQAPLVSGPAVVAGRQREQSRGDGPGTGRQGRKPQVLSNGQDWDFPGWLLLPQHLLGHAA